MYWLYILFFAIIIVAYLLPYLKRKYVSIFLFTKRASSFDRLEYKGMKKEIHIGCKKNDRIDFKSLKHSEVANMIIKDVEIGLSNLNPKILYISSTHRFVKARLIEANEKGMIKDLTINTKTKSKFAKAYNKYCFKASFKSFYNDTIAMKYTKATKGIRYRISLRVPDTNQNPEKE